MVYCWIRTFLISAFLVLVTVNCSEPPNNDTTEERSCSEAEGTWLISKVLCNGETLGKAPFSAVTFDDSDIMTWKVGSADCQSSVDNVYQVQNANLDIFGLSFFECSTNGTELNACSGTQTSCDSATPGSLHSQKFPECVISYGSLKLTRILSEEQVTNGFSFCAEAGQVEEIFYTPQTEASASLQFSTGNGFGFGSLLPGESQTQVITITNIGATDATNVVPSMETPFAFPGGEGYPGIDGSCSSTIPAFSTCEVVIQFAPRDVGVYSHNVEFRFNNGSGPVSTFFLLTGTGEQPLGDLRLLTATPLAFGTQTANTSTIVLARFKNVGTGFARNFGSTRPLAPFFLPGNQFPGTNGTCGKIVGRNQECDVELEFRPRGPGIFSSKMTFYFNNGVENISTIVELEGTAVTADP